MPQGYTKTLVKVKRRCKWGGDRNMHICRLVDMQDKSYDSSVGIDERNAAICSSSIHTKLSRRGSEQAAQCAMMKLWEMKRGWERREDEGFKKTKKQPRSKMCT